MLRREAKLIVVLMLMVLLLTSCGKNVELDDISGVEDEVDTKIGYISLGGLDDKEKQEYAKIRDDLTFEDDEFEVIDNRKGYSEVNESEDNFTVVLKGEKDPEDIVKFMEEIEELITLGLGKPTDNFKVVSDPLMHFMNRDPNIDFGDIAYKFTVPNSDDVYYRVHIKDWSQKYKDEDLEVLKKYGEQLRSGEAFAVEGNDDQALKRIIHWMMDANKEIKIYNATKGKWLENRSDANEEAK